MTDVLHRAQFHHPIGEQAERPAGLTLRTRAARKGNKMSFLRSIQSSCSCLRMKAMVEGIIQPVVDEALPNADYRV
jgi:hypothetical protein